ncbi:hypothetical protein TrCOL_g13868 [Triparma columacea]|uniref:WW domain-containing protein n=1 Tax=Triparma columacea TaxID=722753 RepID=A0A9W7G6K1_9STRA|nr:hypothetical protein TrCOL_g13868 [Triparma columacea]
MEVGLEKAREREKFNTEQALARGVVTVDLEYNFSKDGMPIADQVKAKRTERGGGGFKRTKKSENRLYSVEDFTVGETIEVLYPYDQKWYPATVISKPSGLKLLVNYVGFNDECVVDPVDSCRKIPLMKGWIELIDEDSGCAYYLHGESGESRWERPTKQSESIRRGAVGKGTKVVNRVTRGGEVVGWGGKERPYEQRRRTVKDDPHWRERGFANGNMSAGQVKEYNERRRSFGGPGPGGGFREKEKIIDDQRKRRASFSSVATRSISSSSLPVCNYYHDQKQDNVKNRTGWGGSMGGKRQTTLGQR